MQRYRNRLIWLLLIIGLAACNRSSEIAQPSMPVAVAAEKVVIQAVAPDSPLPTAAAVAPASALPTVTPTPPPPATPTPLTYADLLNRYGDWSDLDGGTPVPAAAQVACLPQGEVVHCHDTLLEMSFRYPTFMGQLLMTQIKKGGYAGYAYTYLFDDQESVAGGRSKDYSEGRGPRFDDTAGFTGRTDEEICAFFSAAICQKLSPGAVLLGILPQADGLCSDFFQPFPRGILVLDLPQHPLINGFSFSFPFLSPEAEKAFQAQWYGEEKICDPAVKEQFGKEMVQLKADLLAGRADAAIQQRYAAMIELAQSVQSPYIAQNP
jgi:hypothetical protein